LRAWEVVEATGRPLSAWQTDPPAPPIAADYFAIALLPPRVELNAASDARFERMMAAGAVAEVQALCATGTPLTAPVFRVLGARLLAEHLSGARDLQTAVGLAQTATRQYAKRQMTWFRHHFPASLTIFEKFSERISEDIFPKIRKWG
jgi:tRNA dimethylallyltransferase